MAKDIRLKKGFIDHPKTVRLERECGFEGVKSLLRLWDFAAENKPKGVLTNMDADDIEIAAKWTGEPGKFVKTLLKKKSNFLMLKDGVYEIHDWKEHQGYIYRSEERSKKAKDAAKERWTSKSRSSKTSRSARLREAKKKGNHTEAEWEEMRKFFGTCVKCEGDSELERVDRDHIIPIYQGGSHGIDNIQPLCAKCNAAKGPELLDYRITYCQKHNIVMPSKWMSATSRHFAGDPVDILHNKTSAPSPYPFPSPNPKQIHTSNGERIPEIATGKRKIPLVEIIDDLNEVTGKDFKYMNDHTQRAVVALFDQDYSFEDFKTVHRNAARLWLGTKYEGGLHPKSLYEPGTFEKFRNAPDPEAQENGITYTDVEAYKRALARGEPGAKLDPAVEKRFKEAGYV